jgi:hypothetical protein
MRLALVLTVLACAACIPENGPMMEPGRDCTECHNRGDAEPGWTAAGTVFTNPGDPESAGVRGVRVKLTDANGRTVTLNSNAAGNFYTRESLAYPLLAATIEKNGVVRTMLDVPNAACNQCHAFPPPQQDRAPTGRIALQGVSSSGSPLMSPGQDCLACHDGRAAQRFTVAGTVYAQGNAAATQGVAGVVVRVRGANGAVTELTSNEAGNFYTAAAVAFPAHASIQQGAVTRSMEPSMDHGSCNRCHAPGGEDPGSRVALAGGDD